MRNIKDAADATISSALAADTRAVLAFSWIPLPQ
jgi:hypothetical protein